jgi:hypothetical protein
MFKVTPNPPETDPASLSENLDKKALHEPAERIPSAADIRATPRTLCTMFNVNPELDIESLLSHACESLASANVITMDLADHTHGPSRNTLLGIANVITMAELAVNGALDRIAPIE